MDTKAGAEEPSPELGGKLERGVGAGEPDPARPLRSQRRLDTWVLVQSGHRGRVDIVLAPTWVRRREAGGPWPLGRLTSKPGPGAS